VNHFDELRFVGLFLEGFKRFIPIKKALSYRHLSAVLNKLSCAFETCKFGEICEVMVFPDVLQSFKRSFMAVILSVNCFYVVYKRNLSLAIS